MGVHAQSYIRYRSRLFETIKRYIYITYIIRYIHVAVFSDILY